LEVVGSKTWRALAVLAAALACALVAQPGSAQTVTERLPDLVADAPARPIIQTYAHPDGTTHLLLRFDGFVHNQGAGAFEMRGSQPVGTDMTLTAQRVYRSDGSFFDDTSRDPPIIWEPEDDHNHWHLMNAARYSLWNSAKTAEVAPALKVGFCLIDSTRIETHGPSTRVYTTTANNFCGQDEPARSSIVEGVSAGWRDLYDRTLAFQWVDITDVQPGVHWLRAEIDPDDIVRESNEVNAGTFALASSTIPGYRAKPVNAGVVSASGPTTINLTTDSFGTPGARVFRIIGPPRHGRLSQASGPTFSTASVVYTPDPGWVGPDSFSYEARDSANTFPRYPAHAAVTLNVGGVSPSVALSGAPASMAAGTSVRLFASVFADNPRVDWTLDGISGGSAQVGSVDPMGLYRAPAQAPPSGNVTIRATTVSGAFDEVTIAITNPPPPQPAPAAAAELAAIEAAPAPSVTETDRGLQGVGAVVDGRFLLVSARSGQAGVVRVRARNGDRRLGRCRLRTPAGRPLTCRIRIPRSVAALKTRVTITLRVGGRLVEVVETDAQRRLHHR
jgi:Lysyl oxidase